MKKKFPLLFLAFLLLSLWSNTFALHLDLEMPGPFNFTVVENVLPNLTFTEVSCNGFADGTATVMPEGGSMPYTVEWSTGENGMMIDELDAGTYSVTVTEASGCSAIDSFTIVEPAILIVDEDVLINPCEGSADGSVILVLNGGAAPYHVEWDNGATDPLLENLEPGTYCYTVTDDNGCSFENCIDLSGNETPAVTAEQVIPTCFGGATGIAQVLVMGGQPPYDIEWSNGEELDLIFGLAAGTYEVTVVDGNFCSATSSVEIGEDPPLDCSAFVATPISASGGSDGSLSVEPPEDSSEPHTYLWSTGDETQTLDGLSAGAYEVTVFDADGCQSFCSVILPNPSRVGDRVWDDANQNGIQDPGEPGVAGIQVDLSGTDNDGNPVNRNTTTDQDGFYEFDGLSGGQYKLTFSNLPVDWVFTTANVGNDLSDSDVLSQAGATGQFNLPQGVSTNNIDAGIYYACDNVESPGLIAGDEYLCGPGNDPGPIVEIAPVAGGSGTLEYVWMMSPQGGPFNNGTWQLIPNSNSPGYDPGPIDVTTHYARCVRREGCISFLETNIVVKEVGMEAVAQIHGPATICVDETVTFEAVDSGPGALYEWYFGTGANPASATGQSVSVSWSAYGVNTVELMVSREACTSWDSHPVFITNSPLWCGSFKPTGGLGGISLYPNPANDRVTVQLDPALSQRASVEVFSSDGRRVLTGEVQAGAYHTFALDDLETGVFLVRVIQGDEHQTFRLVKL